jgi:hypothetical protein
VGRGWPADDIARIGAGVEKFRKGYESVIDSWRLKLESVTRSGGKAVIWGAGSKGVAFLSAVGGFIDAAVDINPNKHGKYMAGTGHLIVSPADLAEIEPALVIAMNPVYLQEIRVDLDSHGMSAELVAL